MPLLSVISGQNALNAFERDGWIYKRKKGSHMIMLKSEMTVTLSIPDHKELDVGTLRALIRKAELTVQEFIDLINH